MKKSVIVLVLVSIVTTQTHAAFATYVPTEYSRTSYPAEAPAADLNSFSESDYARAYAEYQRHKSMDEAQIKAGYQSKFEQTVAWLDKKAKIADDNQAKKFAKIKDRLIRENEIIQDASRSKIQRMEEESLRDIHRVLHENGRSETRGTVIWGFKLMIGCLLCCTFILAPLGIALMESVPDWFASSY